MILLYVICVLALGWSVWSLIDLRRMRRRLGQIERDVD